MKKNSLWILIALSGALIASNTPDIKRASFIKIEKELSKSFIGKMKKKVKQRNIPIVINPKFTCLDAGFTKKDLFAHSIMYGKNRPDGSLEVSGKGDFKAYTYKRYIHKKRECRETTYTKEYDPNRFGSQSYAVIMMPQEIR